MYQIVSFVDTEEVEVVPALWVKGSVCLWPPYKSEGVQRATKIQEQPRDNWTPYNIKVLYTANNYSDARRKLPLAEQQTDLQSEAENYSLKPPKRKIKPKKRLLEDEYNTDEEAFVPKKDVLPQAPRIKKPFKKITVLELGLIGGADIRDTVWHILKQTIKNNLAKTVNWRGVNGKTSFQSLELKSVVT
ncbi:hypothetical protein NFI96_028641, partial [Prochilodus magdalenae]